MRLKLAKIKELDTQIINIDEVQLVTNHMQPKKELIGNIAKTIEMISTKKMNHL